MNKNPNKTIATVRKNNAIASNKYYYANKAKKLARIEAEKTKVIPENILDDLNEKVDGGDYE
jgi:hypothetical protein